jgi:ABC-2 type transport system permease protein
MNRIFRQNQLWELIRARFWETVREPGVIFWGMIFPMLMSLGLGIAFTNKSDVIRKVAVVRDAAAPATVTDTAANLEHFFRTKTQPVKKPADGFITHRFTIKDSKLGNTTFLLQEMTWDKAMVLLKRGNLVVIMEDSKNGTGYHFDPMNPDAQLTYMKLTRAISAGDDPYTANHEEIKPLTVSGTRYIDFLIPGLIAMGVMMSSMWGISYDIIEKRSKKLLRRMVATPMKRSHFLMALMTVRLVMNFVEAGLLTLFAAIVFGVTIQGNIAALFLIFITGNMAFAGMATFISSHTSSTEVGNGYINAVVMPMMVLSGVFFSYHNFPDWSIPFIRPLPATMLADGLRSIFIEGAGLAEIALPSLILAITGILFFSVGLKIFKWH